MYGLYVVGWFLHGHKMWQFLYARYMGIETFLTAGSTFLLFAVLVRSLYGYGNKSLDFSAENIRFLYARYMGIETPSSLDTTSALAFLYARYMGIETDRRNRLISVSYVLVRSLYGYGNIETVVIYNEYTGSCTLAIWVLKLFNWSVIFNYISFLYARYMGIETKYCKYLGMSLKFLYARYMGIETTMVVSVRTTISSCTLAIWVLKQGAPRNRRNR